MITKFNKVTLVLLVIVPVSCIVAVTPVNEPPLDNVRLVRFKLVVPGLNAVVPKFNVLNQLPVVNVCTTVPLPVNVKFGLLVIEPSVVPNVNVRVISAAAVNPPVPVYVNPVAMAIDKLVAAAVVVANTILLDPNAILRVFVLVELIVPIVKSYPPKSNVP